jgi:predicted RND superfamily exporter protein
MFKRVSSAILPLAIVILSLVSTMGLMALMGVSFKLPTQILPNFLIAVGVAAAVHILRIFTIFLAATSDKRESILNAFSHSGLAVLLTSLTTACSLFTFVTAEVDPVADMGIYASIGVMMAFVYTVVLLPASIALLPIKAVEKNREKKGPAGIDKLLTAISRITIAYPYRTFVFSLLLVAVISLGIARLNFTYFPLLYFNDQHPIRSATQVVDERLSGTISIEIVIDTHRQDGIHDADLLRRIEQSIDYIKTLKAGDLFVGKAWSVTTILKEINQALHANQRAFYRLPTDSHLIAQEFFLFENSGSDDLAYYTDAKFSKARLSVRVPFTDAASCLAFVQRIRNHLDQLYPTETLAITGLRVLLNQTFTNTIISMRRSYVLAITGVTLFMVLFLGVRFGLAGMIPNICSIILMLGIMGVMGIKMDLFTMLVGSIILGIAVDDTIHFVNTFMKYFNETGDVNRAVSETFTTTGSAMLFTTLSLSVGFAAYMLSSMYNLTDFGFTLCLGISLALIADFFIAPTLLVILCRVFNLSPPKPGRKVKKPVAQPEIKKQQIGEPIPEKVQSTVESLKERREF